MAEEEDGDRYRAPALDKGLDILELLSGVDGGLTQAELAETSWQANQLVVFDRGAAVVIAQQEAPRYWGISIRVGSHISLFDTGSGHVLLAFRSPEERKMMIAEHLQSTE
ncbi:MAG: IclR family transcriptional regulator, partial [Mesorhizobium sp.]